MSHHHDTGYKELFSYPEFVVALLDGFIPDEISQLLDYSTLKNESESYITPKLEQRFEDAVWSVRFRQTGPDSQPVRLFLYILLEFQSGNNSQMALRMLHYSASFYHQLLKQGQFQAKRGSLPLVFPTVIYNGNDRWTAAQSMQELVQPAPRFLHYYQPRQGYYLLNIEDYQPTADTDNDNLLQLVFNVENARTAERMQRVTQQIADTMQRHPRREMLEKALVLWFKRFLYQNKITVDLDAIHTLQELPPMLANRVDSWFEQWKEEGLEEGRREGREKGRLEGRMEGRMEGHLEGRADTLEKLLRLKFGDLPDAIAQRLRQANEAELDLWSERILFVNSIEEMFA